MIDIVIEIDQYFFSFEPGLVSTSGPGPGQRCNGYLKVHKRGTDLKNRRGVSANDKKGRRRTE